MTDRPDLTDYIDALTDPAVTEGYAPHRLREREQRPESTTPESATESTVSDEQGAP